MSTQEWALAAVFSVPALALVVWASLVRREMKEEQERKKIH
jgi:cell division protein YceG involved in septum cleavage